MGHATHVLIPQMHWALLLHRFQRGLLVLNISKKYRSFLWEHPAYRKHRTDWVLSSLSYGQPGPETAIQGFSFGSKSNFKRFPVPSSQPMCAHCLHAHQHLPSLYSQSLAVGCVCGKRLWTEETRQCRGVSGRPPAPKMLFSILPLPLSSTALQQQTPQPLKEAPKQNQSTGSSLRRAWSSQLGSESTLKWELGPLPAMDSPQSL